MTSPLPPQRTSAPTFIEVSYITKYAPHSMILKTREWIAGDDLGSVPRWSDDTPIDVLTMLTALLTLLAAVHPETTNYRLAKLYTKATPESDAQLRKVVGLDIDGSSVATGWDEAVQLSINGKDTGGNVVRLVQLDVLTGNNFAKLWTTEVSAPVAAAWAEFSSLTKAWQSEANLRPDILISQTATLNEKLRRSYNLT